jgi:hypothetical protein
MKKLAIMIHRKLSLKTETIRNLDKQELEAVAGGALTDDTCNDPCAQSLLGCQTRITCHHQTGTCPV